MVLGPLDSSLEKKKVGFTLCIECQNKQRKGQWFKCSNKSIKYYKKTQEKSLISKEWIGAFNYSKSRTHREKTDTFNQKCLWRITTIGNTKRQVRNWENI